MFLKTFMCLSLFTTFCLSNQILDYEITAEEIDANIERPCRTFDRFCIREYFVKHSHCKPAYGPTPSPLYKSQAHFYVPRANLTITSLNVGYSSANERIEEFYINKETNKLLLSVDFTGFTLGSNDNYFRFYSEGREPIVTWDSLNTSYASFVVTIIIPNLNDLQLQDSEVFLFANDIAPVFTIGPKAFITTDPEGEPVILRALAAFFDNTSSSLREGFFVDSHFWIASFIQYNICDFGLEIL